MKYLLSGLALFSFSLLSGLEKKHTNYGYITTGEAMTSGSKASTTELLGGGYRITFKRSYMVDAIDIATSYSSSKKSTDTYKQIILPKITLLHEVKILKALYFGLGLGYTDINAGYTKEHLIGDAPIKIRNEVHTKSALATCSCGLNLVKTPKTISFFEASMNLPIYHFLTEGKNVENLDLSSAAITFNVGF